MIIRLVLLAMSLSGFVPTASAAAHTCSDLGHQVIAATRIGLPTRGGIVRSPHHVQEPEAATAE